MNENCEAPQKERDPTLALPTLNGGLADDGLDSNTRYAQTHIAILQCIPRNNCRYINVCEG